MTPPQSPYARYAVVVGFSACAILIAMLLREAVQQYVILPSTAAVLVAAWFYGREGGILATVLGCVGAGFFYRGESGGMIAPTIRILTFVAVSALITAVVDALRGSGDRLTATISSIADAVVVTDSKGAIAFLNPAAESLLGSNAKDAAGRPLSEALHLIDEKSGQRVESPLANAHTLLVSKDGHRVSIEESVSPIRDERGRVLGAILIFRDTTKRRQLQDHVSQSQKMDAIGRLAGGVAGDFNNLLTVITGYSEMLRSDLPAGTPLRRFADEILSSAERAAALTRQLLAFSRGQLSQPKLLDVNALIANMQTMLRRLLAESIELILLPGPGLGRVWSDPGQMEQMIVDLAMNSRDAMPEGGRLVIETSNVNINADVAEASRGKGLGPQPGKYVMIVVSDTGVGMTPDTRERLFEPFFTTKAQGRGSGLGLSIVYGIVRQSQGHIDVYSQLGAGTIFEIYLPRAKETVEPVHRGTGRGPKGSETILVAEDEESVRKLVHAVLATNGYSVIEARDGKEALAAYEKNRVDVDMVLTDVMMPQMNGFELGERLTALDPSLKVLYMSGFRDSPIGAPDKEPDREILHKPFTPNLLLMKVRDLLDSQLNSRPDS
ncbi:MAG: response regulator [Acidobacteriota bacterium]|nr:response regulator [Acidobacteriota bacterium]